MSKSLDGAHPTLYKLINQLKHEEALAMKKVMEAGLGEKRLRNRAYVTFDKRLYNLVMESDSGKKSAFLEDVACAISL